uniref:Cytochrome P450 n=1 Tax=Daucus carota subsp. sativus TaxID=79200 RepID=A0A161ZSA6_DAUCS
MLGPLPEIQILGKILNTRERLRHRESKLPPYGDLLDSFLDFQQQNPDDFNIMHIKALLTVWLHLSLDDVMHKVRGEISERIKGKERLEEAETLELHYLQSVLKETMRLHLTVPLLLPHKSETDVKLNGYMIPKNTRVIINAWAIAHDTNSWENPDHFKPERFIGSEIDYKGQHFSFLPFGSGRRMCSGIRLAERAMSLILVSLVAHFDWKLPNNMLPEELDMDDTFGVTAQRATPLLLIPTPASN